MTNKTMTNEKMAHNIVKEVSTIPNLLEYEAMTLCATKMAQWKDEQFANKADTITSFIANNIDSYISTENDDEGYVCEVFNERAFRIDLRDKIKDILINDL